MPKIFSNDKGLIITIDMQVDLTAASSYSLVVKKPNGDIVTWTPTIVNTNYFRYITITGDLDQSGDYSIQPRLTLGSWTGSGDPVKFYVFKKTS